jgi:hypothetical protein
MTEEKSCINCVSFIPGEHHWCKDEKFTMYLFDISVCDEEFPNDGTIENIAGYYGRNCEGYTLKEKTND